MWCAEFLIIQKAARHVYLKHNFMIEIDRKSCISVYLPLGEKWT